MPKSSLVKKSATMKMTKVEVMTMTMVGVAMMMQAMKAEQREKVGEVCQTYEPDKSSHAGAGYHPRVASYITCTICCTVS